MNAKEVLATQISWASYPNDKLDQTDFLCSYHGCNFPCLDGSIDLLKFSRIHFTQCDLASEIISAASSSLYKLFWVTTLVFLGYLISPMRPNQPQNPLNFQPHQPPHPHTFPSVPPHGLTKKQCDMIYTTSKIWEYSVPPAVSYSWIWLLGPR